MKFFTLLLAVLFTSFICKAQTNIADTLALPEVVVDAFNSNLKLKEIGAPVSVISNTALDRYGQATILPALNNTPGVRMEERSPGSYRLSIRGSSLRAPFGVRNVKVYYNGIPYTDPGGNTYLNQLGFYNIYSLEIIRGPGSSLYGAGTGGVLLLQSQPANFKRSLQMDYTTGSFGLQNLHASGSFGNEIANSTISFQHLESDGYRDHTNMRRDVATWDGTIINKEGFKIQTHFLYADLYYQTPGGLTLKEFQANPKAARPAAGPFPGSAEAKAAIYQKTFLAGVNSVNQITDHWSNETALYGAYSQLRNPTVRNYGRTSEPHFGGRSVFTYEKKVNSNVYTVNGGAEYQQSFNTQRIYGNKNGEPDSLQTDDEIYNSQGFIFLQGTANLENWVITSGVSINRLSLDFRRLSNVPSQEFSRAFKNEWMPRLSVLRKLSTQSVYATVSRGFSAPTAGEVLPSANILNKTLQAETGWNYEAGFKSNWLNNRLLVNVNAFLFRLQNAIVQRRDAGGADFFENAGSATQQGIEASAEYYLVRNTNQFITLLKSAVSLTLNDFHYKSFKRGADDFSGKVLPGVARNTGVITADLYTRPGLYLNATYFHSSAIFLNDANSAEASPYDLLGGRVGYLCTRPGKTGVEVFAGADNLLDETYSLGNDINAANGRYYNVAARRNFYAGIKLKFRY